MDESKWIAWKMQTSKRWSDIDDVLKDTNIAFIDHDHQILIEYALKLNDFIDRFETDYSLEMLERISGLLGELNEYAKGHFSREEAFMEKFELPEIPRHKREHVKILSMLQDIITDYTNGRSHVSHKLKLQLMEWLIGHINDTDYGFFEIHKWSKHLIKIRSWEELKSIIRLTGISAIDNQHGDVLKGAIQLMNFIETEPDDEDLVEEFNAFKLIIKGNFDYEKEFIENYHMDKYYDHLEKHDYFYRIIDNYYNQIKAGAFDLEKMREWVLMWLIHHFNITDISTFHHRNWSYSLLNEAHDVEMLKSVLHFTNVDMVDSEHLELMSMTLELNDMIVEVRGSGEDLRDEKVKEKVLKHFDKIYAYTVMHFEHEEKMMKTLKLDDYSLHHHEHELLLEKILNLRNNYKDNRLHLSENVKRTILEWWILHTNSTDYRTFVQNPSTENRERLLEGVK